MLCTLNDYNLWHFLEIKRNNFHLIAIVQREKFNCQNPKADRLVYRNVIHKNKYKKLCQSGFNTF